MTFVFLLLVQFGWGFALLRACRLKAIDGISQGIFAFWVGYVFVSWLGFWLGTQGWLDKNSILFLLSPGLLGLLLVLGKHPSAVPRLYLADWAPILLFVGLAVWHLGGALVPPTEADSLAYHFTYPQRVCAEGALIFQPIAVDGAVPLLSQMVSTLHHCTGGEQNMILLNWLTGFFAALASYVLAREILPLRLALWLPVFIYSLPVMTYGAVNGQVEPKLLGITTLLMVVISRLHAKPSRHVFLLAGLLAGAAMGLKYFGLFTAFVAGVCLLPLLWKAPFRKAFWGLWGFTLVALLIGGQWYGWNAWHTGDPVFPVLFKHLGDFDWYSGWTAAQDDYFHAFYIPGEKLLERTWGTFWWYPFETTFNGGKYDADRTGFGPLWLPVVLLAFISVVSVSKLGNDKRAFLMRTLFFALLFYGVFFFLGTSGRVRHLLPVMPALFVAGAAVLYVSWHGRGWFWQVGIVSVLACSLLVHGAMAGLARMGAWELLNGKVDEQTYMERRVGGYAAAKWAAEHLPEAKIAHTWRPVRYFHSGFRYFYPEFQAMVPLATAGPQEVLNALDAQGITHLFVSAPADQEHPTGVHWLDVQEALINQGCFVAVTFFDEKRYKSRTLGAMGSRDFITTIYERQACPAFMTSAKGWPFLV